MALGRPSSYTEAVAEEICLRLIRGEPLARICDDERMPNYSTVRRWENEYPDFAALSARAKQDGTHYLADDCIRISDDSTLDPANKRIMVDTRLRLIGKWHRKAYGDKQEVEHSGVVTLGSLVESSIKADK